MNPDILLLHVQDSEWLADSLDVLNVLKQNRFDKQSFLENLLKACREKKTVAVKDLVLLLLDNLLRVSHHHICIVTVRDLALLQKEFLSKYNIIEFTRPSLIERRVILELCLDELRLYCDQAAREELLRNTVSQIEVMNPQHQILVPFIPKSKLLAAATMSMLKLMARDALLLKTEQIVDALVPKFRIKEDAFSRERLATLAKLLEGCSANDIESFFKSCIAMARASDVRPMGILSIAVIAAAAVDRCI